jgi:hypothetical protein
MAAQFLSLNNVITVSVSQTPLGVNAFNTSNLALFTTDTPSPSYVFKLYLTAAEVGTDFGTGSTTFAMASAVFAQQPNILLPGGYLAIIPFTVSETLVAAITRTASLVSYFGVMTTQIESQVDMLAAAALIQTLNMMGFFVQRTTADVAPGGSLDLLKTGGFSQSRGLFYDDTAANALLYQAAYAGRALSTVFSGSNTVQNMNLKSLTTIQPDPNITQTILNAAILAGADSYPSLQGVPSVLSSGGNFFFDEIYNLIWLETAIQTAGFNYLKSSSTKIPQTQMGMNGLVGAYQTVMLQAVSNGYIAPGVWNSPDTFGNSASLISNVANFGFYIYATPIALQSQADRVARKAPLVQIAAKESGGLNSSSIFIIVNQ